jgi:hypothetical protein
LRVAATVIADHIRTHAATHGDPMSEHPGLGASRDMALVTAVNRGRRQIHIQ